MSSPAAVARAQRRQPPRRQRLPQCHTNSYGYSYGYRYGYTRRLQLRLQLRDSHGHGYGDPDGNCVANSEVYADAQAASDAFAAPITVVGPIKAGTRERNSRVPALRDGLVAPKKHAG